MLLLMCFRLPYKMFVCYRYNSKLLYISLRLFSVYSIALDLKLIKC